jgi:ribosomal protein L37E
MRVHDYLYMRVVRVVTVVVSTWGVACNDTGEGPTVGDSAAAGAGATTEALTARCGPCGWDTYDYNTPTCAKLCLPPRTGKPFPQEYPVKCWPSDCEP